MSERSFRTTRGRVETVISYSDDEKSQNQDSDLPSHFGFHHRVRPLTMHLPSDDRPLSPITERTTPGSFRTVPLPPIDYTSEREGASSPGGSIYSHGSGHTITQRPSIDPFPPTSSTNHPAAPSAPSSMSSAFVAGSTPSPSGPLPPPRPIPRKAPPGISSQGAATDDARRRYIERYFPKAQNEGLVEQTRSEEGHGRNIAGLGAGDRSRPGSLESRSRPNSFHARPPITHTTSDHLAFVDPILGTANIPQTIDPIRYDHHSLDLHNIPFVPSDHAEVWSPSPSGSGSPIKSPGRSPASSRPSSTPNSRQGSVKQRPHSFHASRPSSRPNSAKGSTIKGATSADGQDEQALTNEDEPSPESTLRPKLKTAQSETSLSRTPDSFTPHSGRLSSKKTPPRRRTVSSIFGSIFGTESSGTSAESTARKLTRRSRRESQRASTVDHESAVHADSLDVPVTETAIRTSGTFGIRDDGSEMYIQDGTQTQGSPGAAPPPSVRHRTKSGTGSAHTLELQRVMVVQNGDTIEESVLEDDRATPLPGSQQSQSPEMSTEESSGGSEAFYTPADLGSSVNPVSPLSALDHRPQAGQQYLANQDRPLDARPRPQHRRSFSPPTARSAMFVPLQTPLRARPLTPPPNQVPSPPKLGAPLPPVSPTYPIALTNWRSYSNRPGVPILPIVEGEGTADVATQTSPRPATSTIRPLPRPPSISSRPPSVVVSADSHVPQAASSPLQSRVDPSPEFSGPFLNIPPPPSVSPSPRPSGIPVPDQPTNGDRWTGSTQRSTPASDLPLLIASHLLSTHAAALMRHSTTMRDVSEVMAQMAKESLDWGGILLGLSQTGKQDVPPNLPVVPSVVAPQVSSAGRTGKIDGLPGRSYHQEPIDPLQSAWDKLNGHNRQSPHIESQSYRHPYSHNGGDMRGDTDNFTPIPQRPTASRKSSRARLKVEEEQRHALRNRHASLPSEWVGEADRLGKEGWENIRRAEEAWKTAIESFKVLAEQQGAEPARHMDYGNERDIGMNDSTIKQRVQSRHESLDMSYLRKMKRADWTADDLKPRPTGTSFHPREEDLLQPPQANTGNLDKASRILGPHNGIDIYPPVPLSPGYTNAHLGFDDVGTVKARPGSRMTHKSIATVSTRRGKGEGGRKLSKKSRPKEVAPPIPSFFRTDLKAREYSVPLHMDKQATETKGEVEAVSGNGTKRHWWSRRRAGSLAT